MEQRRDPKRDFFGGGRSGHVVSHWLVTGYRETTLKMGLNDGFWCYTDGSRSVPRDQVCCNNRVTRFWVTERVTRAVLSGDLAAHQLSPHEDGAAVDAPGLRRLSGLFPGPRVISNSEGEACTWYVGTCLLLVRTCGVWSCKTPLTHRFCGNSTPGAKRPQGALCQRLTCGGCARPGGAGSWGILEPDMETLRTGGWKA